MDPLSPIDVSDQTCPVRIVFESSTAHRIVGVAGGP